MATKQRRVMLSKFSLALTIAICFFLPIDHAAESGFLQDVPDAPPTKSQPQLKPPSPRPPSAAALESEMYFTLECTWTTNSLGVASSSSYKDSNTITVNLKTG